MLAQVSCRSIVALVAAIAGCTADKPALTDAAADGPPCSPFADQLVAFTQGTGGPSMEGAAALGAPDGDLVSVGPDASLTVSFVGAGAVSDGVDFDIQVHGNATADVAAVAYVSEDGTEFRFAGDLTSDALLVDLATASVSRAQAFRVIGVAGELALDAVEAIGLDCSAL